VRRQLARRHEPAPGGGPAQAAASKASAGASRRNEVLMSRKLDAIRGALHTLRGADPTAPVEVYDRLGRMARMRGGRGYEEV
jgi:hypothetical protein